MSVGSKITASVVFATKSIRSAITRPANTTAYATGDVISDGTGDAHHTFQKATRKGAQSGMIRTARVISSANQATKPDLELWLFRTDIADVADNAAYAITDTEHETLIGIIDFPVANWKAGNPGSGAAGSSSCEAQDIGLLFEAGTASDIKIYGQLVVRNTYTPVSAEKFTVDLVITQD